MGFFKNFKINYIVFLFLAFGFLYSCGIYKKTDAKSTPINALERAKKNVDEGRAAGLGSLINRGTNFEFSSSNPLWRASLNVLDFIPLTTADYSGGVIITDWYTSSNDNDSIKITIRFLSNEIASNSLKIIVHKKSCNKELNCTIKEVRSNINEELLVSILKQASILQEKK